MPAKHGNNMGIISNTMNKLQNYFREDKINFFGRGYYGFYLIKH